MTARALIVCPWPSSDVGQNARPGHWAIRHRATKRYRADCRIAALAHVQKLRGAEAFDLELTFCPPSHDKAGRKMTRSYDDDNLVGRFKAGRDGIADALEVDDSTFRIAGVHIGEPVRGGAVLVDIRVRGADG